MLEILARKSQKGINMIKKIIGWGILISLFLILFILLIAITNVWIAIAVFFITFILAALVGLAAYLIACD